MKKLTLVSLMCRNKIVTAFVMCPYYNNKAVVSNNIIDILFDKYWGFTPQRGETISFL